MFPSLLTTLLFSFSAIFANRSIKELGTTRANLGRLIVAILLLGTYAHLFGYGMSGAGRNWFLISGVIGMGLGDLALFAAMPRLGARLTVLMCQCVAVPIAIQAEWVWMGTRLTLPQLGWAALIIVGVAVALMPSKRNPPQVPVTALGFLFGFLAAVGQGLGAVVSRHAYELTAVSGQSIDGISAAYQRISGGLFITAAYFVGKYLLSKRATASTGASAAGSIIKEAVSATTRAAKATKLDAESPASPTSPRSPDSQTNPPLEPAEHPTLFRKIRHAIKVKKRGWLFVIANALCGPALGVSCYQWALATTPSGIVLPIVATTPLVIIPLSYWLEGDRPSRRSMLGGVIAVAGVVALTLAR
jgi:drug/metabolite transporter (DMT)-like permease